MANMRFWSVDEDKKIAQWWPDHTAVEIAHKLSDRTPWAVGDRARRLGLPSKSRPPINFTEEDIETIVLMREAHTLKEIAAYFKCSVYPISIILTKRGLGRVAQRRRGPPKGWPGMKKSNAPLRPLEMSHGHFAVDARSYELITQANFVEDIACSVEQA